MSSPPRPARGRAPSSTYRLQLNADFTLDAAIEVLAHLAELGVGAIYLSPLLAAVPGSTHGYDVVDPGRIDEERGGEAALRRLSAAAHAHGQQVVLDIVPNHLSVQIPRANAAWWDVLTYGAASSYARWFDVDWDAGALLLPVLGADTDLTHLQVVAGPGGPELAYYEHRFPVAPGTEGEPGRMCTSASTTGSSAGATLPRTSPIADFSTSPPSPACAWRTKRSMPPRIARS